MADGGDGTINKVSRQASGTCSPLGILPAGSGNRLARHFKIPIINDFVLGF
ncbi:MAG: diacylglycerol kinase family protein [Patescibacteria group bacterium]